MRDPRYRFPPADSADEHGLVARSNFIDAEMAFAAHSQGIFPWYNPGEPILWWSPDPRAIILTAAVHTSRSLRKLMRRTNYRLTLDTAFTAVIDYCASCHGATWITGEMRQTYLALHEQGRAHSCELWQDDELVGGLYGVALERIYCGESMFSLRPSASKIVLVRLCAMPAAFKNLIDWGSRYANTQNHKLFADKPVLLLSTSPGPNGGASNLALLAQLLPFQGAKIVGQYSRGSYGDHFDADGKADADTQTALREALKPLLAQL